MLGSVISIEVETADYKLQRVAAKFSMLSTRSSTVLSAHQSTTASRSSNGCAGASSEFLKPLIRGFCEACPQN